MGKMTVYHGSYTVVRNPKIITGRNTPAALKCLDFLSSEEVPKC